jgi:hypothetical protein
VIRELKQVRFDVATIVPNDTIGDIAPWFESDAVKDQLMSDTSEGSGEFRTSGAQNQDNRRRDSTFQGRLELIPRDCSEVVHHGTRPQ